MYNNTTLGIVPNRNKLFVHVMVFLQHRCKLFKLDYNCNNIMLKETQKTHDLQHSLKPLKSYSTLYLMIFNKSTKGRPLYIKKYRFVIHIINQCLVGRMDFTRHFNCSQMFEFFIWDHNGKREQRLCLWKSMEIFSCCINVNGTVYRLQRELVLLKKKMFLIDKHHLLVMI